MFKNVPAENTATRLLAALGAYLPRVTVQEAEAMSLMKDSAKRRTRPLIGRGNYGRNLRAYFDSKRAK